MRNPKLILDPMDLAVDGFETSPSFPDALFDPTIPPTDSGVITCALTCFRSCVC